jgi:F-type H+-transporting ATPase subunit b
MEILNQFGFDIKLFVAQIINFLVIAYVFKRFLFKPILNTLQNRNKLIKKGLKDAEDAAIALNNAQNKSDEILSKASKEAERIIAEAKELAQNSREKIIENTKKEIEKMMQQTKEQIELERIQFQTEAKDISLEISRQILETAIIGLFDKKEQEEIIKKGAQKIKSF